MARQTTRPRARATGATPPARRATSRPRPPAQADTWRRSLLVAGALGLALLAGIALYLTVFRPTEDGAGGAIATLTTADFHSLAFNPADPNVVFFGHHNGVMRSGDGGRSWSKLADRAGFDAMGMAVDPQDPRRILIAGHDVFQMSSDGGDSWQRVQHNLPGTDIHGFTMSPADPSRLYAFVVGAGFFRSADGGRTWERTAGQLPPDVMMLAAGGDTLYAASMRLGVLRSDDGGQSWSPSMNGLSARMVLSLAVDRANPQTVYAGAEGGLYKSTDAGASWQKLPFPGKSAVAVAVSAAQPGRLLAISAEDRRGLVYRSEDGGRSWGGGG